VVQRVRLWFFSVLAWDEALDFPDTTMPLNGVIYGCGSRSSGRARAISPQRDRYLGPLDCNLI
jgi:hypothetical protein